ncbi:hypothetical protein AFNJKBDN_CDS0015 [Halorubrum virus V_ICIS4]|nr:hypothetical protein AFNJKBDN_CDS0015 [Halorubrum virus V_ICIS4]
MSKHTPWSENRHIRFLASLGATIIAVGLIGLAQAMAPFENAGLSILAAGVLVIGVAIALQELIFGPV